MMNQTKHTNAVVAVYNSHGDAEACVQELQKSGFDMKKLSILGRDCHTTEHVVGYYNTGDRAKYWGTQGAFWGGVWGWLFGSTFFFIPGLGSLLFAGPIVGWIVGALEGAVVVGGLSALGACLYSLGIPKNSILKFETTLTGWGQLALKTGKFIVIAHGTAEDVDHARSVLARSPVESPEHHPMLVRAVPEALVSA
jgi:hypothetical protein